MSCKSLQLALRAVILGWIHRTWHNSRNRSKIALVLGSFVLRTRQSNVTWHKRFPYIYHISESCIHNEAVLLSFNEFINTNKDLDLFASEILYPIYRHIPFLHCSTGMLHEHYSGELIRKHYEGHFILFFTSLPRFIEDNEGWINKRKCKPQNPVKLPLSQSAFVCT